MWLSSADPHGPSKSDHYLSLVTDPLSDIEVNRLRKALKTLTPNPTLSRRVFIRLDVTTSWGGKKQVYLVLPERDAPPDEVTLGMECINNCMPIDKDPWFFKVIPAPN